MKVKKGELTANQRRFAEEYVKTYNIRQSYCNAYSREDYIPNNHLCSVEGGKLLKQEKVMNYIKELQHEAVLRFGDMAELIARELMEDILQKDEEGKHNSAWQKSVDLLQKQLNLQSTKIDAKIENDININITEDSND